MAENQNNCPSCGKAFSSFVRRRSRMTWPGRFIFLLGVLIGLPWAILVIGISMGTILFIPLDSESFVTWLKVVLGPGYFLAKQGYELPRRKMMRCLDCGWRGEVMVSRSFGKR